jgi:hypothetical protein
LATAGVAGRGGGRVIRPTGLYGSSSQPARRVGAPGAGDLRLARAHPSAGAPRRASWRRRSLRREGLRASRSENKFEQGGMECADRPLIQWILVETRQVGVSPVLASCAPPEA